MGFASCAKLLSYHTLLDSTQNALDRNTIFIQDTSCLYHSERKKKIKIITAPCHKIKLYLKG